jgi:HAMP domain-containing protein
MPTTDQQKQATRTKKRKDAGNGTGRTRGGNGPSAAAESLTRKELLAGLRALRRGEFDVRLPDGLPGLDGDISTAFNDIALQASTLGNEFSTLRVAVGSEGRTKRRMRRGGARGGWGDYVTSMNELLDDLTSHTDEMARVVTAVAKGDLTQSIDLEGDAAPLRGDFARHARAVNGMVTQLGVFGSEVTRVAQEVGMEGKLGAQAKVPGVSGTWKELTDSVNLMASNLTAQVREIARVTTAVAQGDLTKTVNIEVKGEILELKNTINTMVDQLGSFADEVTRVAREVGTEGILGGQARVRGVSGVSSPRT